MKRILAEGMKEREDVTRNHRRGAMKDLRVMMGTSRIRLAILVSMAIGFGLPASQAASNAWKTYGDVGVVTNDWNNPNNWTNSASFPNAVDDVAVISGNIWTHGCFIALNQQITVGSLATGDTAGGEKFSFTPGTSGSLVFQAANGNAALTHIAGGTGQDTFTCPLILSNTLQVSVLSSAPGDYAFNASVSGNGGIIKNGPGVLWLVLPTRLRGTWSSATGWWFSKTVHPCRRARGKATCSWERARFCLRTRW
jgi:hypothetical protein